MVEDKKKFILPQLTNKNKSVLKSNTQIGSKTTSKLTQKGSSDENILDDLFEEVFNETESDYSIELKEKLKTFNSNTINLIKKINKLNDEISNIKEKQRDLYNDQQRQKNELLILKLFEKEKQLQLGTI